MDTINVSPIPTFLTYGQAAAHLGISERTLRRRVRDKVITHLRPGGQVRFTVADLDEYLVGCTVPAVAS